MKLNIAQQFYVCVYLVNPIPDTILFLLLVPLDLALENGASVSQTEEAKRDFDHHEAEK